MFAVRSGSACLFSGGTAEDWLVWWVLICIFLWESCEEHIGHLQAIDPLWILPMEMVWRTSVICSSDEKTFNYLMSYCSVILFTSLWSTMRFIMQHGGWWHMEVKLQNVKLQRAIGLMSSTWMLGHCHEKCNKKKQSSKQPVSWMNILSCLLGCWFCRSPSWSWPILHR